MEPEKSPLKQIRTFQGDVAEALHTQNESLVSIHQTEALKDRMDGIPSNATDAAERKRRNDFLYLFLGSAFLVLVGLAGAWYGYIEFMKRSAPPVITIPESRFISPNSEVSVNFASSTRQSFGLDFHNAVADLPSGELKHVVARNGDGKLAPLMTTSELLAILESRSPGNLVRSFSPLFMIGAVGESPFIIIRLISFENAFAGMLNWEGDLANDLGVIFTKANGNSSVFRDVIVKNKDVRVLYEGEAASSTPVLLYSFFDNSQLIITDRIGTLEILLERLSRERLSR